MNPVERWGLEGQERSVRGSPEKSGIKENWETRGREYLARKLPLIHPQAVVGEVNSEQWWMALHDGAPLLGTILGFCHICFMLNRNTWYFLKKKREYLLAPVSLYLYCNDVLFWTRHCYFSSSHLIKPLRYFWKAASWKVCGVGEGKGCISVSCS